jgi:uncharacterized surface protein with fasciclin (FAS1) repeats
VQNSPRLTAAIGGSALVIAALLGCGRAEVGGPPVVGVGPGTYGPACPRLPVEGADFPGTAAELIDRAAVGDEPMLTTLAAALRATGLRQVLADPDAEYTVFAPVDTAFDRLPAATLQRWRADPRAGLDVVLRHHVVEGRHDADALAARAAVDTLVPGDPLVVTGAPARLAVGEREEARVLCGNVRTTNATVFLVDEVLVPDGEG